MAEYNLGRVGFVVQGEYVSTRSYKRLDFVTYQGDVYCCKQDVGAGVLPTNTSVWTLFLDNTGTMKSNLGAQNKGKYLVVGDDGAVSLIDFATDKTLALEGKAADAKAVGDKLTALKNEIVGLIDTEAQTRADDDDALQDQIDELEGDVSQLTDDLSAQAATRKAADDSLTNRINYVQELVEAIRITYQKPQELLVVKTIPDP